MGKARTSERKFQLREIALVAISLKFHLAISTEELTSLQALCSGRKFQLREISLVAILLKFHLAIADGV